MKKQFREFLKSRKPQNDNQKPCTCDDQHWCNKCVAQFQEVDLRSDGLGQGYVFSNIKED